MNTYYHIYNRGVDRRKIFLEKADYRNFLERLYKSNDQNYKGKNIIRPTIEREEYVNFLSYALMPNHFHLFLEEKRDGGTWKFMSRVLNGYTKYFNKKYSRSGRLFESKFKKKRIITNAHFQHISRYIHLNPVSLIQKDWKQIGIQDWDTVMLFIENYPWSSLPACLRRTQDPLVDLDKINFDMEEVDYIKFLQEWQIQI